MIGLGLSPAQAKESAATDCLVAYKNGSGAVLAAAPTAITCKDGDPTCDADGTKNGSCTFTVQGCVNIADVAGCTQQAIKTVKFKPPTLGISVTPDGTNETCSANASVVVKLKNKGKRQANKRITALAIATAKKTRDQDVLKLTCQPCPDGDSSCNGGGPGPNDCSANPDGGPDELTVVVGPGGGDLDTGESGRSHNFINVPNSTLKYCLTGCNGSSDTTCHGSGPTGAGTINGPAFGPPLPLFSSNVAVCVVNRFADATIQTDVDLTTGSFNATATPLNLLSDTYQGSPTQVCPKCVAGKCDSGRRAGQSCTVGGTVVVNNPPNINNVQYPVSADCLPSVANLLGTPHVALGLTSGTSMLQGDPIGSLPCPGQTKHDECGSASCTVDCSNISDFKGGINQTCCSNAQKTPCFPTDTSKGGSGVIERTGSTAVPSPALPDTTYPKTNTGVLAATFCIQATGSNTVDFTAGLPGPGATLLPGTATYSKNP